MDLPSSREIELETLLRQRDAQLLELTDEVTHLRQYLSTQPGPSTTDSLSLPPAFASLLLPHITVAATPVSSNVSTSATAALTQRTKLLLEENEELYEILRTGEIGKVMEEVKALRKVVDRLEKALKESHHVIVSLSTELDKSYELINSSSPRSHHQNNYTSSGSRNGASPQLGPHSKPPPTGPRAHKKPRLLEPGAHSNRASVGSRRTAEHELERDSTERERERNPASSVGGVSASNKMDTDDDERSRSNERVYDRERDRERDRDRDRHRGRARDSDRERLGDRERERDGEREKDRERSRNGGYIAGRRGNIDGVDRTSFQSGDRTLAERLGL